LWGCGVGFLLCSLRLAFLQVLRTYYGVLDCLARQRIYTKLIARNWDDFLRVAGSLKIGTISGSELIRSLQRGSKKSMLAGAIGEAVVATPAFERCRGSLQPLWRPSVDAVEQDGAAALKLNSFRLEVEGVSMTLWIGCPQVEVLLGEGIQEHLVSPVPMAAKTAMPSESPRSGMANHRGPGGLKCFWVVRLADG